MPDKPKVVFVSGVFDLFHRGHVELLKRAAALGDQLYVGVNGDDMVAKYKRRPVFSQEDRLEIVRAMACVTDAVIYDAFDLKPMVEKFRPDYMVHGDEWPRDSYLKQICMTEEDLVRYGVELVFLPYWNGTSTTAILKDVNDRTVAASPVATPIVTAERAA